MPPADPGRSEHGSEHWNGLDGLRGIAALVVVIRHCFNAVVMPTAVRESVLQSPLVLFLNGQGAVQLFFVLSGFVLAASLSRSPSLAGLPQYFTKRVFRIHPPYVFAVLFAWSAAWFYPDMRGELNLMPAVRKLAAVHIDVDLLLQSLVFPSAAFFQLPVGWTLRVEMIFSLLLPVMFFVARRSHWVVLIAASSWWLFHPDRLFIYSIDFSLGIAAFMERDRLKSWARSIPSGGLAAFAIASLVLLHAPQLFGWSNPKGGVIMAGFDPVEIATMGLGAVTLVICVICIPWFAGLLSTGPCRFLGRISYSLYLVHGPILILFTSLLAGGSSRWLDVGFFASVIATSILVSTLTYRWVERPSIAAGNWICKWFAARVGVSAIPTELGTD